MITNFTKKNTVVVADATEGYYMINFDNEPEAELCQEE